jgi:uncharacterized protein (TIGR03118 family)
MQSSVRRILALAACCGLVLMMSGAAAAQFYTHSNLTSNLTGKAKNLDTLLQNPWGLAYGPGGPFWVSDEASGYSTLYNGKGVPQSLQVVVPPTSGTGKGSPTGIVYNSSTEFQIFSWTSAFLFATLDGTISGWSHFDPNNALIGVRHAGSVYTGLAITNRVSGNLLYAADVANNKIDVYDGNFNLVNSFTDPAVPAGFSTFGVQDINGQLYVTFAQTAGKTGGYVDLFKEDGTLIKHFAHGKPLNQPWGVALAPSNFGPLSGTILVSNNTGTGTINGFNAKTGAFVDSIKGSTGSLLVINGLWGIEFGGGTAANGKTNELFYTAGPKDTDGYFGVIDSH